MPSAIIEAKHGGIRGLVAYLRNRSRHKRIGIFRGHFNITPTTRLFDLGGWDGSHVNALINGTSIDRRCVYVADINESAIETARVRYGFTPVLMSADDHHLAFPDAYFDIVFCSSVLEHVTVPKNEVWNITDSSAFRTRSIENQTLLASEIRRLGKQYYVQVPYRGFPIETHTWLPLVAQLPRSWQLKVIGLTNKYWIKQTTPDFYLPTVAEIRQLFPDANILWEKALGLNHSITHNS